jgi:hypothetical protein
MLQIAEGEQLLDRRRSGLQQTSFKLQRDADRLKQVTFSVFIGMFPVLQLANVRRWLFGNALVHLLGGAGFRVHFGRSPSSGPVITKRSGFEYS